MEGSHLNNLKLSEEDIEYLGNIRIIQKNLIHIQGIPKCIARTEKLKSFEYLGQYGKIIKAMVTYKKIPENNKKAYSAYITYSNEMEAAFAILCVDSLLINGKIIRAFFGTTKYCLNFLNNTLCPNSDKCLYLHHLIDDKDLIIDQDTSFSYNEHLSLSKKIIQFSNPLTKELISKLKKPKKSVFPFMDFIFLNEKEKEKYFSSGIISYFSCNNSCIYDEQNNFVLNNFINKKSEIKNNIKINSLNMCDVNNIVKNFNLNKIDTSSQSKIIKTSKFIVPNTDESGTNESFEFRNSFDDTIKHILFAKPFFSQVKNFPLRKMELDYLKNNLKSEGKTVEDLLGGCLDNMKDLL